MTPDPTLAGELNSYLGQLGADDQARVVQFARTLLKPAAKTVRGTPGKELLRIVGSIPHEVLMQMKQAIEEDA
jgi:hypothetical protein